MDISQRFKRQTRRKGIVKRCVSLFCLGLCLIENVLAEDAQSSHPILLDQQIVHEVQETSPAAERKNFEDWNRSPLSWRYANSFDGEIFVATLLVLAGSYAAMKEFQIFWKSAKKDIRDFRTFVSSPEHRVQWVENAKKRWNIFQGPDRFKKFRLLLKGDASPRESISCRTRLQSLALGLAVAGGIFGGAVLSHSLGDREIESRLEQDIAGLRESRENHAREIYAKALNDIVGKSEILIRPSMISKASREDGLGRQAYSLRRLSNSQSISWELQKWEEEVETIHNPNGQMETRSRWQMKDTSVLSADQVRWIFGEEPERLNELPISEINLPAFNTRAASELFP